MQKRGKTGKKRISDGNTDNAKKTEKQEKCASAINDANEAKKTEKPEKMRTNGDSTSNAKARKN